MKIPKTESKTVEFKKTFNQDTIESLVAFANADGGCVYVGVRDDGKVLGVDQCFAAAVGKFFQIHFSPPYGCIF